MVHINKVREEFSQRLAQACSNAGLNERGRGAVIMKALGVSSKAVSKWFNGESLPRQDKIEDLAQLLKCDVVWLQHGKKTSNGNDGYKYSRLTKREEKLLDMFNALTEDEQKNYLKEITETRANLERIYKEMKEKEKKSKRAS